MYLPVVTNKDIEEEEDESIHNQTIDSSIHPSTHHRVRMMGRYITLDFNDEKDEDEEKGIRRQHPQQHAAKDYEYDHTNIHNTNSCTRVRLPAFLTALLLTLALTTSFLGSTSCDFLQVNAQNATLMYYEEDSIGIFCVMDNDKYTADVIEQDTVWLITRVCVIVGLVLGFLTLTLGWVLVTVYPANDSTQKGLMYHVRGWRILGILSGLSTVANVLSFLLFDVAPCKAQGNACEIRLGCFLLIVSCVLYVSVVFVTECTSAPVSLDGAEAEDWRNATMETDEFEYGYGAKGRGGMSGGSSVSSCNMSSHMQDMSELTDAHLRHTTSHTDHNANAIQLSPAGSGNNNRRQVHPLHTQTHSGGTHVHYSRSNNHTLHVQPNTTISPAALRILDDTDTTVADSFVNKTGNDIVDVDIDANVAEDEEDPAEAYAKYLDQHRRQWDTHPDELLVPELSPNGNANAAQRHKLFQRLKHHSTLNFEGYNKLMDDNSDIPSIEDDVINSKKLNRSRSRSMGYPTSHTAANRSYLSGESEAYLMHLIHDRGILDNTDTTTIPSVARTNTSSMDDNGNNQPPSNHRRPRRGRSTTPRSYRTYSAPSTPTGQVHGTVNSMSAGRRHVTMTRYPDDTEEEETEEDDVSRITMDANRPRSYTLPYHTQHIPKNSGDKDASGTGAGRKTKYSNPPKLPIMLSSSASVGSTARNMQDVMRMVPPRNVSRFNHGNANATVTSSKSTVTTRTRDIRKVQHNSNTKAAPQSAPSAAATMRTSYHETSSPSTPHSHAATTALLDESISDDQNDTSVMVRNHNVGKSTKLTENEEEEEEALGLHSPLLLTPHTASHNNNVSATGSKRLHSPSILYLGEQERVNAIQRLNSTPNNMMVSRVRSNSTGDVHSALQDQQQSVVFESSAHVSMEASPSRHVLQNKQQLQQQYRPHSSYHHTDRFRNPSSKSTAPNGTTRIDVEGGTTMSNVTNMNTINEEESARSASVPPVMRMRKLRQKIMRDRFGNSPNNNLGYSPSAHTPNTIISNSNNNTIPVHTRVGGTSLSPSLQPRDRVSWSVREEIGQTKFDWEERRQQHNMTTPPMSPLTSVGGMVEDEDLSYDYRNDRFVSGRSAIKPFVTP